MGARIDRLALMLSQALAVLGGAMLLALIAMVCVSVSARASGWGPVTGDYELIELGTGFAVFAFMPWCQVTGAHARVDLLAERLGPRAVAVLDALWAMAMAAVMVVIAWRLGAGMLAKRASGETTFLRQIPVWWGYAAVLAPAWVAALVAGLGAVRALWTIRRGAAA